MKKARLLFCCRLAGLKVADTYNHAAEVPCPVDLFSNLLFYICSNNPD
jgi:hypothetical protein